MAIQQQFVLTVLLLMYNHNRASVVKNWMFSWFSKVWEEAPTVLNAGTGKIKYPRFFKMHIACLFVSLIQNIQK